MKMKIIFKSGEAKYYNGKSKSGEIMLVSSEKKAKDFSSRAKGTLNQIGNQLCNDRGAVGYEYIN